MVRFAYILRIHLVVAALALLVAANASAASGNVLVFGSADNGSEGDNVASTLTSLGYDVDRQAALPANLATYSSIWYIEAYKGLSAGEQEALETYIQGGGSAYLTGERPCCEELNDSVEAVLETVLSEKDVTVGGLGDINGPFTFNPDVEDDVSSAPNTLVDFVPDSPGGMAGIGGIGGSNVFASNGSTPVGAIFDERDMSNGRGRVALLMDIDWLTSDARAPIIENIQDFLDHGRGCTDDGPEGDPGFHWSDSSPRNCSVLISPSSVSWSAVSDHGPVSFSVSANGVVTNCSNSQAGGFTTETCSLSGASATGTLQVTASDSIGSVVRRYRVRPKNDPRNVPPGFSADSNWWEWPDADQDGIPNYWEESGVWVNDRYLDLPDWDANPQHKDLFLRLDFEAGFEFDQQVIDDMEQAFGNSPLTNPDGTTGVTLHVDGGASAPASVVGQFQLTLKDIQRVTGYTGFARSPEIGGIGVPQIFHWMLNFDSTGSNVIGSSEIGGHFGFTAFPVDKWEAALHVHILPGAAANFAQATNTTHELGHQLGLHHHGAGEFPTNDTAYKSVMSYAYSNFGVPGGLFGLSHRIDYSRTHDVNLDWQMGQGAGKLTFLGGQWGEEPDFYAKSANEIIDTSAPQVTEPTLKEAFAEADPEAIEEFVSEYAPEAEPDIPSLGDAQVSVPSGANVTVHLPGFDPESAPLSYVIVNAPTIGTVVPVSGGISYSSPAGASGADTVLLRATNGTFSSKPAMLTIHLNNEAGPATTAPLAASPAPRVVHTLPRKHCRKGFKKIKRHHKPRCAKIKRHGKKRR
jgi:hypothetical protein